MEEERKKERKERKKAKARLFQSEKQTKIYTPLSLSPTLCANQRNLFLSRTVFSLHAYLFFFFFFFLLINVGSTLSLSPPFVHVKNTAWLLKSAAPVPSPLPVSLFL
jgi:hypothetical protein